MTESLWRLCRRRKGTGVNYREELAAGMIRLGLSIHDAHLVTGYSVSTLRSIASLRRLHVAPRVVLRSTTVIGAMRSSPGCPRMTLSGGVLRACGWKPGDKVEAEVTKGGELVIRRVGA